MVPAERAIAAVSRLNFIGGALAALSGLVWLRIAFLIAEHREEVDHFVSEFLGLFLIGAPQEAIEQMELTIHGQLSQGIVYCSAIGVLCFLTAGLLIVAGVLLQKRRPAARKWVIAAALVSFASVWTFLGFIWLLLVAAAIYAIVTIRRKDVRQLLGLGCAN